MCKCGRDTLKDCPDVNKNSTTITNAPKSYTITGLEEWSSYIITVTASNAAGSDSITGMTSEQECRRC